MANPDDTTLSGDESIATAPPERDLPRRPAADAPDRLLFFFSGFDPKGATFYHRLFRTGIAQRNSLRDETLALGKRHRVGRWASAWTVLWRGPPAIGMPLETLRTRVHFMRWDDIVRRHWRRPIGLVLRDYWNVYAGGLQSGTLLGMRAEAPEAFGLALLPLQVAGLSVLASVAVVGGGATALHLLAPASAVMAGLLVAFPLWRAAAGWVDCEWLVRLQSFLRMQAIGDVPTLDARLDDMALRILEAVEARLRQPGVSTPREIMFVGYGSGSVTAASVLARALPRLDELLRGRHVQGNVSLSMLTLGHCLPAAAEWPGATKLRAELASLATHPNMSWLDCSSSSDPSAWWRTTPWPQPAPLQGGQVSPVFEPRLTAWAFATRRRERREIQSQYLRTAPKVDGRETHDFFGLTCGPQTQK
jgi:hypothetical protein